MLGGVKVHKNVRLILDSFLFDAAYYASQCGNGLRSGTPPVVHYLSHGRYSDFDPHPLFDTAYYLEQEPELDEEVINPVIHYIEGGPANRRSPHPLFDADFYLRQNLDIESTGLTPLGHYLALGVACGADPNEYFGTEFYLRQVPGLADTGLNPLVHYLQIGAANGLDPSPRFGTRYYLEQNPDVAGSGLNPLVHFLVAGRKEGRPHRPFFASPAAEHHRDGESTASPELLRLDYLRLRQHEPLLPESSRLGGLPELRMPTVSKAGSAYFSLLERLEQPFTHLFLMPFLLHGGAEKVCMNMVRCVAERSGAGAPLVLVTDSSDVSALQWLPTGVRLIVLDHLQPDLSLEDKEALVLRLILQTRPCAVTNSNSQVGWNLYRDYGRQLSASTHLAANLFGYGIDSDEVPYGLPVQYLNPSIEHLTYLFSDSRQFRDKLVEQFGLVREHREKQVVLYSPLPFDGTGMRQPRIDSRHGEILWASRLSPGKRPDILLRIARRLPDLKFHVWGQADDAACKTVQELNSQPNIVVHGRYEGFDQIPLGNAGIFLYTTDGDGIPLVLLEALAAGLPVVAPRIGGIPELIGDETGWLIEDCDDVDAYAAAIRKIRGDRREAMQRVLAGQALVRRRHLWGSFSQLLGSLELYWEKVGD